MPLAAQQLVVEKTFPPPDSTRISSLDLIKNLADNNLLLAYKVRGNVAVTHNYMKKITPEGNALWEKEYYIKKALVPKQITEESNGGLTFLCHMAEYVLGCSSAIHDYTPAYFFFDREGNLKSKQFDSTTTMIKKSGDASVYVKPGDNYILISLHRGVFLVKEFDSDLQFLDYHYCDTLDGYYSPLAAYPAGDGYIVVGQHTRKGYWPFIGTYSREHHRKQLFIDSLSGVSPIFASAGPSGTGVCVMTMIYDKVDSSKQRMVLKRYDNEGSLKFSYEYNALYLYPKRFLNLDDGGYLIAADSLREIAPKKFRYYCCLLRIDENGKLLWKTTLGNDSSNTFIENFIYVPGGNYYFSGKMGDSLYYAHVRDYTLGIDDETSVPANTNITVTPNPASDKIDCCVTTDRIGTLHFFLYNENGKEIMKKEFNKTGISHSFPVVLDKTVAPGAYFYRVTIKSNTVSTGKVVVSR